MTDSTNRTLITVMIIIGIVIIILFFTQGFGNRNAVAYNGSYYAASALPFNNDTDATTGINNGYPIVTRTIPSGYVSTPTPVHTTSTGSNSTTTTTYSYAPTTPTPAPVTTTTYPSTYYPTTSTTYPYSTPTTYNYAPTTTNGYYPNTTKSCPTDTMECPDGSYVGRGGPYCAFTLCQ